MSSCSNLSEKQRDYVWPYSMSQANFIYQREKEVFLACRQIFSGKNALIRQPKKIKDVLDGHKSELTVLISSYGLSSIIDTARDLLKIGVFESTAIRLSKRVGLVYMKTSEGAASLEFKSAKSELDCSEELNIALAEFSEEKDFDGIASHTSINDRLAPQETHKTSLPIRPAKLQYRTQRDILIATQSMLEDACFEFGRKWMPSILKKRGWQCSEAAELTEWTRTLSKWASTLSGDAFDTKNSQLTGELIHDINHIRHVAVHRIPQTPDEIDQMLTSAIMLATMLKDENRSAKIELLRS
ncbi:MAG: hypothetical protein M1814_003132 [Vezdaea aestivalis]|nr:MAG: hypothetical protein M1814_003132 [Vezdaea aestivalis]